ncbi:MAG: L,D-transpeptidase family protein [Geodermatophilaceae bacterium]|nr:L,D-transpeptidase family protein [Geodermatophilaceae bacterium]
MTQVPARVRRVRACAAGLAIICLFVVAGCSRPPADATEPTSTASAAPTEPGPAAAPVLSIDPPLGSAQFAPMTPVTIAAGNGTLSEVVVTDATGAPVAGTLSADAKLWQSELLRYDATYSVAATAVNEDGAETAATGSITTVTPRTFTMPYLLPSQSMETVGVGMPIVVKFDEDIEDRAAVERRLAVTTTPSVVGSWYWFGDREVHYRPQEYWVPGTHVVVDVGVYGVHVGDNIYGQENQHLEFDIHDALVAQVDNSELTMRTYRNGVLEREMPTSLGKSGFSTPSGTYIVMQQDRYYTMDSSTYGTPIDDPQGYRLEVEYASRISYSGIFVHAAPWSVGDQGVRNVSHGCLNVSTANAGYFYENFGWGDIVQVTGTDDALEPTDGLGDWNIPWERWILGSAL